jgi:hypothetical protein
MLSLCWGSFWDDRSDNHTWKLSRVDSIGGGSERAGTRKKRGGKGTKAGRGIQAGLRAGGGTEAGRGEGPRRAGGRDLGGQGGRTEPYHRTDDTAPGGGTGTGRREG